MFKPTYYFILLETTMPDNSITSRSSLHKKEWGDNFVEWCIETKKQFESENCVSTSVIVTCNIIKD